MSHRNWRSLSENEDPQPLDDAGFAWEYLHHEHDIHAALRQAGKASYHEIGKFYLRLPASAVPCGEITTFACSTSLQRSSPVRWMTEHSYLDLFEGGGALNRVESICSQAPFQKYALAIKGKCHRGLQR